METATVVDNYSCYCSDRECDLKYTSGLRVNYFVMVLYTLLFIFGLVGNVLVITVLIIKRFIFTIDVYLFNIALSDMMLVFSFPFIIHNGLNEMIFGKIVCKLVSGTYFVGFFSNMFFIMLISIDRYISVVNATKIKSKSINLSILLSVSVWVCSIILSSPVMVLYHVDNMYYINHYIMFNGKQKNFSLYTFLNFEINIFSTVILTISMYCYFKMLVTLKSCRNSIRTRPIKIILAVVTFTTVFWIPFNAVLLVNSLYTVGLINISCYHFKKIVCSIHVLELISFFHCCVNPIIYSFVGKNFFRAFKTIFCKVNKINGVNVSLRRSSTIF
ncbi:145R [Yaba monkey tumor virus]|uniref:145R n=1 Tax=Yaba monkey tumor virus (strain VR587) TaxID=928314 RepID=Q6TUM9_YMTV5|nr:chemokine receptor-like protein [Yaba monkey tumor virus]AAR07497.1 145R [Yaba monkey tumor virus]